MLKPSYYPMYPGLAIPCSRGSCKAEVNNYCYNPWTTFYTYTDDKEQAHFFHKHRIIKSVKIQVTTTAFYHLKAEPLENRKYFIAKYYPVSNQLLDPETNELYSRDRYTFHGFTEIPDSVYAKNYNKALQPGNKYEKEDPKVPFDPFGFIGVIDD